MNSFLGELVRDGVVTLTLNRQRDLNAYDLEMLVQFKEAVARYSEREDIQVLVVTGSGAAFCTGARIVTMLNFLEKEDLRSLKRIFDMTRETLLLLRRIPQYSIAAINGPAIDGGLNLALCCDYQLAVETAKFGYPWVQIGLAPDVGTSSLLHTILSRATLQDILITGRLLDAAEALDLGLIRETVGTGELESRTERVAERVRRRSPVVIRSLKKFLDYRSRPPDQLLELESEARMRSFLSEDIQEGILAFQENRQPQFKGR